MLRRAELASLVVTVTAEHALEWINRSGPGLVYYSQKWPPSDINFGFLAQITSYTCHIRVFVHYIWLCLLIKWLQLLSVA
jgi:hypothetical protein